MSLSSLFDQLVLAAVAEDTSDTVEAGLDNILYLFTSHQIEQGYVRQFFLQKYQHVLEKLTALIQFNL